MRQSRKGYILTEIMMSMLLHSMFILVLASSFYMMLSFYTKTQQLQTARSRAKRVILYIDTRIMHAGLGFWRCESSKEITTEVLKDQTGIGSKDINFPVSVSYGNVNPEKYFHKNDVYSGDVLTMIYAYKDFETGSAHIIKDSPAKQLQASTTNTTFNLLDNWNPEGASVLNIRSYVVMEGTGLPLYSSKTVNNIVDLKFYINASHKYAVVNPGSELLYLNSERMFVEDRSFSFSYANDQWKNHYRHEAGILGMYMELTAPIYGEKILDLWVLATGGTDNMRNIGKPATWPGEWKDEYNHEVVYVSRASWKLHNIPENFVYSYYTDNNGETQTR